MKTSPVDKLKKHLYSIHPAIQFTVECERNGSIHFLDAIIPSPCIIYSRAPFFAWVMNQPAHNKFIDSGSKQKALNAAEKIRAKGTKVNYGSKYCRKARARALGDRQQQLGTHRAKNSSSREETIT